MDYFQKTDTQVFSERDKNIIQTLSFVSASLSLCGCLFVIFSFLFFKNLQTFPFKLIFFVSCTELFVSCMVFLTDSNACWINAAITDYFELSTMMWISVISYNIYQTLCKGNKNVESLENYYHVTGWGIPVLLWVPVAVSDSFGEAGIWCWIPTTKVIQRWVCYYGPWAFVIMFNILIHIYVTKTVYSLQSKKLGPLQTLQSREQSNILTDKEGSQIILRLRLYVFVFLWVSLWSFGHRINELVDESSQSQLTFFAIMHAFFRPLQGFLNSLVYGIHRKLLNEYKIFFLTLKIFKYDRRQSDPILQRYKSYSFTTDQQK
eukprot:c19127_g1_i2.p1 GENE.c19127_g1_i2~~c19127_g1_i2.p1  ORF type:complete len:319 (+),score=57.64 c19127_g1_i2:65-1021(+)